MSKISIMFEADSAAEMASLIAEAHVEWGGKQQIAPPPAPVYSLPVGNKAPEAPVAEATKEEPTKAKAKRKKASASAADSGPVDGVAAQADAPAEEVEEKSVISAASLKAEVAQEPAPVDPFAEEEPRKYTFPEITAALKKVVAAKGMPAAVAICQAFGAEKITAVKEADYPAFMAKVEETLA